MPGVTSTDSLGDKYASFIGSSRPPTAAASDVPLVYMGKGKHGTAGSEHAFDIGDLTYPDKQDDLLSMIKKFERMDRDDQRDMAFLLTLAGFGPSVAPADAAEAASEMSLGEVIDAYASLLDVAAGKYAAGQKVTPDQLLAKAIAFQLPGNVNWNGDISTLDSALAEAGISTLDNFGDEELEEEEDLSGTFTSTTKQVSRDIMDPNDAMALTRGMLQRELGRDPTKGEFEDFISTLQGAQQANPTVQTSRLSQTTDVDGRVIDTSSNSTTRQGIGAAGLADVALREARSNPSWAEWQAVGTYAPALFEALGATVAGR